MAILLEAETRICVLGITGSVARRDLPFTIGYGTLVTCGIAPGHGGELIEGIPVFDTAEQAMVRCGFDAVIAYLPPGAYGEAVPLVIEAQPEWIAVITEGIPIHTNVRVLQLARTAGVRIIGPAISGVISPGLAKVGFVDNIGNLYSPGRVGVMSRSGGQQNELANILRRAGLGISTAVPVGGDAVVGTGFAELATLFEKDPSTDLMVVYTESGPDLEGELIREIAAGLVTKPIIAIVTGDWLEAFPAGRTFGHAGAFIGGELTTAASKRERLAAAGVTVVGSTAELLDAASRVSTNS
jgi:succinyl-CoA synthetase alpha subunit